MRAILMLLLGSLAFGSSAVAEDIGNAANAASGTRDLSNINFNLAAPGYGKAERLPEAATLSDLSSGGGGKSATTTASKSPPNAAAKVAPRPVRPKPKPKLATDATWQGKPMSAWRRAYIAKHGHQPPVPVK